MIQKVTKRDGTIADFSMQRIADSIKKAMLITGEKVDVDYITDLVMGSLLALHPDDTISIEEISDMTEHFLEQEGFVRTCNEFKSYRAERTKYREANSNLSKVIKAISIETDRDNANVGNNFSAKLLRIGSEASKWYVTTALLPKNEVKFHENGEIYDQDLDSINLTINCLHIPTKRILDRGFNPGYGLIRKPNCIETAAMLSCILLQSSQNDMFGGQSHPNFDNDLSEYVMTSRKKELTKVIMTTDLLQLGGLEDEISLLTDLAQEDYNAWDEEIAADLKSKLKAKEDKIKSEMPFTSLEDLEAIIDRVVATKKAVKEYVKDIPTSDQAIFWEEFFELWDNHNYFESKSSVSVISAKRIKARVESAVYRSVRQAMQTVVYNLNTMHSRAGAQVPFSSVNIGIPKNEDAALLCEVFLDEYNKGLGNGEQPIFPNIIFRVKAGVNRNPEDPYFYLYKKACDVAAHRMNPTFMNLDSTYYKPYYDKGIIGAIMGCRTAVCSNVNGKEGPEGRGNIAPATINLVRIGLYAKQSFPDDEEKRIEYFFETLNDRLQMCVQKLMTRYDILKRLRVKDIPFSIGQGLMQGNEDMHLNPDDSIEPILKQGTWGIGFIGIAETLICLIGEHQGQSDKAQQLGLKIVKTIRDYADKQTKERQLNFGCYATPAEGLCGKLVKIDRKRFGVVPGVTDKDYYTNSYHIPVSFHISIMKKMALEAPYQVMCNSGCISYIEFDGEPTGDTIRKIVTKTFTEYPDMNYMAGNYHKRTCLNCKKDIHGEDAQCPYCGSRNIRGVSRVTGYLSLDERFGVGKAAEKADRVSHAL